MIAAEVSFMRRATTVLFALALALLAVPLSAYTVYLKDGSKIVAKQKYEVQGDKAIITLPNGTPSFIDLAEIDVKRTEEANRESYGSAVVIERSQARDIPSVASQQGSAEDKSLQELIQERSAGGVRALPEVRREESSAEEGRRLRTPAGWIDLAALPRRPYSDEAVATELKSFLRAQELDSAKVFQGTTPGRPFLEIPASSEAAVFRGLLVGANALLHARERFGDRVRSLELLMLTPTQQRGGQFVLTPDQAERLAARQVEVTAFFLYNVQF